MRLWRLARSDILILGVRFNEGGFVNGSHPADTTGARRAEIQANQFAAALLMPAELVREAFAKCQGLSHLARLFNVSEAAMGFRLDRLRLR